MLGLLAMLEGQRGKPAAQALAGLLDSRTLLRAAEVLVPSPDSANYECRVYPFRHGISDLASAAYSGGRHGEQGRG